jgi:hypothetical protein
MGRSALRNRYQKAAYKRGERRVSRAQVAELIELARSEDDDDRFTAARFLCPCHVRGRTEEIWNTVIAFMSDDAPRVRAAAWHTLEDGGVPSEPGVVERLAAIFEKETDASVLTMARLALGPALAEQGRRELAQMRGTPGRIVGKCDFCGERNVAVERDFDTMIPTSALPRPALICGACAKKR